MYSDEKNKITKRRRRNENMFPFTHHQKLLSLLKNIQLAFDKENSVPLGLKIAFKNIRKLKEVFKDYIMVITREKCT